MNSKFTTDGVSSSRVWSKEFSGGRGEKLFIGLKNKSSNFEGDVSRNLQYYNFVGPTSELCVFINTIHLSIYSIYTVSTLSTQYLNSIYTVSTQCPGVMLLTSSTRHLASTQQTHGTGASLHLLSCCCCCCCALL